MWIRPLSPTLFDRFAGSTTSSDPLGRPVEASRGSLGVFRAQSEALSHESNRVTEGGLRVRVRRDA
eukprot:9466479-Pyramimonas_sp.AAC.1